MEGWGWWGSKTEKRDREASDVRAGAVVSYETHVNLLLSGGTNY